MLVIDVLAAAGKAAWLRLDWTLATTITPITPATAIATSTPAVRDRPPNDICETYFGFSM